MVRPVYFPRFDGLMEWSAPDGSVLSANFHDELDRTGASFSRRQNASSPRSSTATVAGLTTRRRSATARHSVCASFSVSWAKAVRIAAATERGPANRTVG